MDIETYIQNDKFIPYSIGFYDGTKMNIYYLTDFASHQEMIINAFNDLLIPKYKGHTVYFHNLQGFDGILLLKTLENNFEINTIFKENKKILKFTIKSRRKEQEKATLGGKRQPAIFSLFIKDSYLLLPHSLRKLANEFQVQTKGYFPYKFVNENTLNYIGASPTIEFFDNIDQSTYD
jgi:hypothetical protein